MSPAEIAAIIGALGLGTILPKLVEGIIGWATGRQTAERQRWQALEEDREDAVRARDREASMRRRVSEHASELRRLLITHGVPADQLPPWPIPPRNERTDQP